MRSSTILALAGLIASSTAIDIRFYNGEENQYCGGKVSAGCTNVNPNTCCSPGGAYGWTMTCNAIPTAWHIECRAYEGSNCWGPQRNEYAYGWTDECVSRDWNSFRSGGWGFVAKKTRGEEAEAEAAYNAAYNSTQQGEGCRKPDFLEYTDGP
ncbi:uncharacterized protein B0I36DRAFT_123536 [Microdochium trichocladiopsis]|uniref:Uncharacterized protein n=1 Tax=Microdochium trichocladiopsis TaxID=1682393 RepID=A0A9P9BNR3_9PEZI|nr:uncharacterized protein B0I36DRAFT_123536 [Microdochium trichocladiopsis]KAH7031501.1 hypothetical protein B0I36DRAFT_123536 [Microdochium trichocladiopsis]